MDAKQIKDSLLAAGIPPRLWKPTLADFGDLGKKIRSQLKNGFADDCNSCNVYGAPSRIDVFNTFAKESVICGYKTYLTSLRSLVTGLSKENQYSADYIALIESTEVLFISGFFDTGDCPYPRYDIAHVEDFLSARVNNKKSIVICAATKISNFSWWTDEFKHILESVSSEYYLAAKKSNT